MRRDTIAAIATPPGIGGVSVIRISGSEALRIAKKISHKEALPARQALFSHFYDAEGRVVDSGLLLYFAAPHSFTGEEVVELQGHGGIAVSQLLLQTVLDAGARLAQAGEFSQRAFLNDKIDLSQAEAIADLIHARSADAVRAAHRSLQGAFSKQVYALAEALLKLRVYIEAALDFPEEDIDFLAEGDVAGRLQALQSQLESLLQQTAQATLLNQGLQLVLLGAPNAGKSSLLNALLGEERAIVHHQAGTTRDAIRESWTVAGIPVLLFDTAGLRETEDEIEREGVRRSRQLAQDADFVIFLRDGQKLNHEEALPKHDLLIYTKADQVDAATQALHPEGLWISARTGQGLADLKQRLQSALSQQQQEETPFIARQRHVDALQEALHHLRQANQNIRGSALGELIAEDLRAAHDVLGTITGRVRADDLLGHIFSSFCIGK